MIDGSETLMQYSNIPWWGWTIIVVVGLICLVGALISIPLMIYGVGFFTLIISVVIFTLVLGLFAEEVPNQELLNWKEDARTYVSESPEERHEIVYIKLDPETSTNVKGSFFLGAGRVYSEVKSSTPMTVAYKTDNDVKVKTFWAYTSMELSEEDKPFLTYQNLSKDLGHGINSGWYNPKVHLPADYEFDNIK